MSFSPDESNEIVNRAEMPQWQREAIHRAEIARRAELEPLRAALDDLITSVGWRRAKPVLEGILDHPIERQRGAWWREMGKRNLKKATAALTPLVAETEGGRLW